MTRVSVVVLMVGLALVPMGGLTVGVALASVGVVVMLGLVSVWLHRGRGGEPAASGCRGCGYGFEGLCAERDGCVVCPECGAAWRLGGDG